MTKETCIRNKRPTYDQRDLHKLSCVLCVQHIYAHPKMVEALALALLMCVMCVACVMCVIYVICVIYILTQKS